MQKAPASRRANEPIAVRAPGRPGPRPWAWLPVAIMLGGALLRIVYAAGSDVRNVYDDHFEVTRIILEQHRWPHPDENWEAYQPPLYHSLSALVYWLASGRSHVPPPVNATPAEQQSGAGIPCPYSWHAAGRKAIQFVSVAAGIGTLALVWLTLRWLFPRKVLLHAVGVAFAAFLPRLIYMSGMATNDALLWLWSSLCVYATLRARAGDYYWWAIAGLGAALALWTKHNGLGCLAVLAAALAAGVLVRDAAARHQQWRGAFLALGLAVVLGAWPYVRTYRLTGNPIVSPYTRVPNKLSDQLPGDVSRISWTSLRIDALLRRPWVHLDTVFSFWSSLYGELWFDFGTPATVYQYRPWLEWLWPIWGDLSLTGRERERRGLTWDTSVMPRLMLWEGRFLIALGVLPTILAVIGLGSIWRQAPTVTTSTVLVTSLLIGVATPIFQTIRQPFRAHMKATFALHAIAALTVLFVAGYVWVTQRRYCFWLRWIVLLNMILLGIAAVWHFSELALVFPGTQDYFARRDPL